MKILKYGLVFLISALSLELNSEEIHSVEQARNVLECTGDFRTLRLCEEYFEKTLNAANFLCDAGKTDEITTIKVYELADADRAQNFIMDKINDGMFPKLDYLVIQNATENTINNLIKLIKADKFLEPICISCIPAADGFAQRIFDILPTLNELDRLALPIMGPKDLESFEDAYMKGTFSELIYPSIQVSLKYYNDAVQEKINELKKKYRDGLRSFIIETF